MESRRPRHSLSLLAMVLALGLSVGAACGTRVNDATPSAPVTAAPLPGSAGSAIVVEPTPAADQGSASADPGGAPARAGAPNPLGASAPAAGRLRGTVGPGVGADGAANAAGLGSSSNTTTSTSPVRANLPDQPSNPVPGRVKSPLVLASVGTYSGPVGAATTRVLDGVRMWVASTNARGGLNGRTVELVVYDDGGDVARHRAQVQDAVERRKVLAFVANADVITGESSVEYINRSRIPVIGVDGGEQWPYQSPMYFPQMSTGEAMVRSFVPMLAKNVVPKGKQRVGIMTCVEAKICDDIDRIVTESASKFGLELVYKSKTSLAQPDFTAECLQAKSKEVDVFFITFEQSGVRRVASSCARQGYRPIFSLPPQSADDAMKVIPELDGALVADPVFPYFRSGTPATDEYQHVVRVSGQKDRSSMLTTFGWTSAKLVEKVAAKLPEPPTREALLASLWTLQNETLGGLVPPMTFVKDQPARPMTCWFTLAIEKSAWTSPDEMLNCL